jgi:hypothetical protein
MLSKEDYVLTELLGRESPQVKALVAASANPGMESAAHEMLRGLARQRGWDPDDLPRFALPREISVSDYAIGTAMSGNVVGEEIGPSEIDLPSHIGVFGMTNTGKSTLVKLLLCAFMEKTSQNIPNHTFCILDMPDEYRDLLALFGPDDLIWLTADEIGINPFDVPIGPDGQRIMSPEKWINNVREWLRLFWLNEPSCNLFCEILLEEYERWGVLKGGKDYPRISDIIDALKRLSPPKGSDRERAKGKLLDRLQSLRGQLPGLDVQRSRDFSKLMQRSVILDLSDVKDIALPVLFALLVTLMREVFRSDGSPEISRMLVLEEAHEYAGGQTDKRTSDLKEGKPSSFLRDLRKTGACGVVVSHLISDLASSVRGNLGTIFSLRQGDRQCIREAASALILAPWQEPEIARLPNQHAVARFSRFGEPVYLAVKDARALLGEGSPPPSKEEARARSKAILEAIPYVRKCEPPKPEDENSRAGTGEGLPSAGGGLHPKELRVYSRIASQPWETIEDRMDALGLDRETEGDARAKLESRGLIAFAGKVGAKCRLFELTARGRELARTMGLPIAKPGKGSTVHESIVYHVQRSLGRHSAAFRFQRARVSATTAGVQPDSLLVTSGGGRIPIQACFANHPDYEAAALLRLHRLSQLGPGDADKVDFVLGIAASKHHKDALERALKRENGGSMPGRVVLLDFDEVVDPEFDWTSLFEMPI